MEKLLDISPCPFGTPNWSAGRMPRGSSSERAVFVLTCHSVLIPIFYAPFPKAAINTIRNGIAKMNNLPMVTISSRSDGNVKKSLSLSRS